MANYSNCQHAYRCDKAAPGHLQLVAFGKARPRKARFLNLNSPLGCEAIVLTPVDCFLELELADKQPPVCLSLLLRSANNLCAQTFLFEIKCSVTNRGVS